MPEALLLDQLSSREVERRHLNFQIQVRTDQSESQSGEQVVGRRVEIIQIHRTLLPHYRVIIHTGFHVGVDYRVVVDLLPADGVSVDNTARQQHTLLDLNVDNLVLLLQAHPRYNPRKTIRI